jgi:hypothetical protein
MQSDTLLENRVIGAVERAIELTNQGQSPNDAIAKVAAEQQLGPELIGRMAEAFNKSKSVAYLKQASADDRPKAFELADTATIVARIYTPVQKTAAVQPPQADFSAADLKPLYAVPFEKAAQSLQGETIPVHSAAARLEKFSSFCTKVREHTRQQTLIARHEFNEVLKEAVERAQTLSDQAFEKVAQLVVNGYPQTGRQLMQAVAEYARKPLAPLQKTASCAVFPAKEPYLTIARVYAAAQKYARAKYVEQALEKQAAVGGNLFSSFLGAMAATQAAESGKRPEARALDVIDPQVFNQLKELEAREALTHLMLYDPDLKRYELPKLVGAYNRAVSMAPEAFKNPAILKSMMVQDLETGGVKDPMTMRAEATMAKDLAHARLLSDQQVRGMTEGEK